MSCIFSWWLWCRFHGRKASGLVVPARVVVVVAVVAAGLRARVATSGGVEREMSDGYRLVSCSCLA